MAPSAAFITTRPGRVLHWLFPSRRAVLAVAVVDIVAVLLGFPLPVHIVAGLVAHVGLAFIQDGRRRSNGKD